MEGYDGTRPVRLAYGLHRIKRLSLGIFLDENFSFPANLGLQIVRKGIHAGHSDTVKASGNLVTVLAELSSGMKHRQHDFEGRTLLLLVHPCRYASAVILDRYGIVMIDSHLYIRTEPGKCLIDTVVHNLVYKMVQSSLPDVPDIHGRPFPHGLKPFEHLYAVSRIILRGLIQTIFLHSVIFKFETGKDTKNLTISSRFRP